MDFWIVGNRFGRIRVGIGTAFYMEWAEVGGLWMKTMRDECVVVIILVNNLII